MKDWERADAWQEFLDKESRSAGIEQDIRALCGEIDKKIPFQRDKVDSYVIQDKEDENWWIRNYLIKYHLNKMPALVEFLEEQREKEFGRRQPEDMEV